MCNQVPCPTCSRVIVDENLCFITPSWKSSYYRLYFGLLKVILHIRLKGIQPILTQDQVEIGVPTCHRLTINLIDAHSVSHLLHSFHAHLHREDAITSTNYDYYIFYLKACNMNKCTVRPASGNAHNLCQRRRGTWHRSGIQLDYIFLCYV